MRELLARGDTAGALGRAEGVPLLAVGRHDDGLSDLVHAGVTPLQHARVGLRLLEPELQEGALLRIGRGGELGLDARHLVHEGLLTLLLGGETPLDDDGLGDDLGLSLDHGGDDDLGGRGVLEILEPGLRLHESLLAGVDRRSLALVRGVLAPAEVVRNVRGHLRPGDLNELTLDRGDEGAGVADGTGLEHGGTPGRKDRQAILGDSLYLRHLSGAQLNHSSFKDRYSSLRRDTIP